MNHFEANRPHSDETVEGAPDASDAAVPPTGGVGHQDGAGRDKMNGHSHFKFVLYIAGGSPYSVQAVSNLRKLCIEHLQDQHEFEIVDVLSEPGRALADRVLLTPTLVKLSPGPVRRMIGSLNLSEPFLRALGLLGLNRPPA